jgi:hypothetical protein
LFDDCEDGQRPCGNDWRPHDLISKAEERERSIGALFSAVDWLRRLSAEREKILFISRSTGIPSSRVAKKLLCHLAFA